MSDWKEGAAKRRDFRHTRAEPETPRRKGKRRRTQSWCNGVQGESHDPVEGRKFMSWICIECAKCHKIIEFRSPK